MFSFFPLSTVRAFANAESLTMVRDNICSYVCLSIWLSVCLSVCLNRVSVKYSYGLGYSHCSCDTLIVTGSTLFSQNILGSSISWLALHVHPATSELLDKHALLNHMARATIWHALPALTSHFCNQFYRQSYRPTLDNEMSSRHLISFFCPNFVDTMTHGT